MHAEDAPDRASWQHPARLRVECAALTGSPEDAGLAGPLRRLVRIVAPAAGEQRSHYRIQEYVITYAGCR
jgi:hypothetical protein